ncbi:MAG: hypothetical protein MUE53_09780 [Chitinophagales bacterium]|nr:hypothetical protein [Chitinophagales bacterium]
MLPLLLGLISFILLFILYGIIVVNYKTKKLKDFLTKNKITLTKAEQWEILNSKVEPHEDNYNAVNPRYHKAHIFRDKLPKPFKNYALDYFEYDLLYPYFNLQLNDIESFCLAQIQEELLTKNEENSDFYLAKTTDNKYYVRYKERGIWFDDATIYDSLEEVAKEKAIYSRILDNINDYIWFDGQYIPFNGLHQFKDLRLVYRVFKLKSLFTGESKPLDTPHFILDAQENTYYAFVCFKNLKTAESMLNQENKLSLANAQNPENRIYDEKSFFYNMLKKQAIEVFVYNPNKEFKDRYTPLIFKNSNGANYFLDSTPGAGEIGMGGPNFETLFFLYDGIIANFVYLPNSYPQPPTVKQEGNTIAWLEYSHNGVYLCRYNTDEYLVTKERFQGEKGKTLENSFYLYK